MPRTDTSDPITLTEFPPWRAGPFLDIVTGQALFHNQRSNTAMIITTMDLGSLQSGTSTACAIGAVYASIVTFGGQTGAGQFDTFSWRGFLPLYYNEYVYCFAASGNWSFTASGYWLPAPAFVPN